MPTGFQSKFYRDAKTGYEVEQLTNNAGNNYQLYFTDNSFTLDEKEIYFLSDRASVTPDVYNFFRQDLVTGEVEQVTHESNGVTLHQHTKSPGSEYLVYVTDNQLVKFDTRTSARDVLYESSDRIIAHPFISPDLKKVGVPCHEKIPVKYGAGANYAGFKETMYAVKKSWIVLCDLDGTKCEDVYEDHHWMGHFQFAPDDSNMALFCHEGPWNLVNQRIWILDVTTGKTEPCFRQDEDDCVGHEFWTRDGRIFFDNRRKGHDGTITSDKTQATIQEVESGQVPYVAFANKRGEIERKIDLAYYCNHYHANTQNSFLVGDAVEDLLLMDIRHDEPIVEPIVRHDTSWKYQRTHCHPTFAWDDQHVLFTSDRDGLINIYRFDLTQVQSYTGTL